MNDTISSLKFENDVKNDPRSNFMKKRPNDNYVKEPTWVQGASLKDAFNLQQLQKFKSALQQIKTILKKIKSILNAIRSFLQILEELIELGEDILGALLETVIKEIFKIINNIASTGIYYLPVIDYYATSTSRQKKVIDAASTVDWWDNLSRFTQDNILNPYGIDKSSITMSNNAIKELLDLEKSNTKMQFDDNINDLSKIGVNTNIQGKKDKKDDTWGEKLRKYIPFRSTTYDEFINVIINALNDPYDLPAIGLSYDGKNEGFSNVTSDPTLAVTEFSFDFKVRKTDVIHPGAPKWSGNSNSMGVVIALNLPAVDDLTLIGSGVIKGLLLVIEPIYKLVQSSKEDNEKGYSRKELNKEREKKLKEEIENVVEKIKKTSTETSVKNKYEKAKRDWIKVVNEYENEYEIIYKKSSEGGEYYKKLKVRRRKNKRIN
jgi:hypothetical protein